MANKIVHGVLYSPVKEDGTRDEIRLISDINDIVVDDEKNLKDRLDEIEDLIENSNLEDISNTLNDLVENKAPKSHASEDTTYGVGTSSSYGHVKTVEDYKVPDDSDGVVVSQKAIVNMFNELSESNTPKSHASEDTTYGVGTSSLYGHLKIDDTYESPLENQSGVAASQKAVNDLYVSLNNRIKNIESVGLTSEVLQNLISLYNSKPVPLTISDEQPESYCLWANTGSPVGSETVVDATT